MAKTWNQEATIRGALRRAFSRSPVVREVLFKVRREVPKYNKDGSRAKKDAVQYKCNVCLQYVGSTKVSVDHITPVVDVQLGFVDFNTFIARLFCDASNLQVICDPCHNTKTQAERIGRLTLQYNRELDQLESAIKAKTVSKVEALSALKKYLAKKKTPGLNPVVQRALNIKDVLTQKE
jgi:5-methylcytosine-specific restriction endonuclease McrA